MKRDFVKPLIIMTPKSLLRSELAASRQRFRCLEAEGLPGVSTHRTKKEVFGKTRTIVVTANENLLVAQSRTLLRAVAKKQRLLGELQASLHDVLDSTGPLNIGSGAAANFTLLGNITTTHFVFANYPTGGLTGTFGAPTFSLGPSAANVPIPTGASIANDTVNHQLVLNVSPQSLRGNFNLDSTVDASDIAVMLQALTDLNAYKNGNNPLHVTLTASDLNALGDFDNTGSVTNRDIQPMLDYIASLPGGGSVASVPEPASLLLLALGGMFLLAQRRARNRTRLPAVKF
jgi:hypothetical protein